MTFGKSHTSQKTILTNNKGYFNKNFIEILTLSIFKKEELKNFIKKELESQISILNKNNIKISHLDGRQHIHTIPLVWNIINSYIGENKLKIKLRVINENF